MRRNVASVLVHLIRIWLVWLLCIGYGPSLADERIVGSDELYVQVVGEIVSVDIRGIVPIDDILQEIGEQLRIDIRVNGKLGTARPQSFIGRPLMEAIKIITGNSSVVAMYYSDVNSVHQKLIKMTIYAYAGEHNTSIIYRTTAVHSPSEKNYNHIRSNRRVRTYLPTQPPPPPLPQTLGRLRVSLEQHRIQSAD